MKQYFSLITLVIFVFGYSSCTEDTNEETVQKEMANRTVIVYMIADNNLDYFAEQNIIQMQKGWDESFDGNLIVYVDRAEGARPSHPITLKITSSNLSQITSPVVKSYVETNSCDATHMRKVLQDIIAAYPAKNYGLILWSHGTSWFPNGFNIAQGSQRFSSIMQGLPLTKSFGLDRGEEMAINELPKALPVKFDFIIFDACFMGSIEVEYELRDKANYIMASASEILSYGFPYESIVSSLFKEKINLNEIGDKFIEFYNEKKDGLSTATISVVKTSEFNSFIQQTQKVFADGKTLGNISISDLQQFDIGERHFIFDLGQILDKISSNDVDYKSSLNKLIIYKNSTNKLWNKPISHFSGLSIYIPIKPNLTLINYYEKLSWYNESGYSNWAYN